jgi:hypothetical protein
MTEALVTFLRARLDEAGERARANAGDERHQQWAMDESADYNEAYIVMQALDQLRQVEAQRLIVEVMAAVLADVANYDFRARYLADEVLRLLASPHAEHEDYRREQWKP